MVGSKNDYILETGGKVARDSVVSIGSVSLLPMPYVQGISL